jgi:hypothetical protein
VICRDAPFAAHSPLFRRTSTDANFFSLRYPGHLLPFLFFVLHTITPLHQQHLLIYQQSFQIPSFVVATAIMLSSRLSRAVCSPFTFAQCMHHQHRLTLNSFPELHLLPHAQQIFFAHHLVHHSYEDMQMMRTRRFEVYVSLLVSLRFASDVAAARAFASFGFHLHILKALLK